MSIQKATHNRSTAIHQNNNRELQKNCLIPMEISRKEAIAMGINPAEIRPVKIGNRLVDGMLIPASSEEQYRGIIRDIWKEEQHLARSRKCSVSNGHGGLKRCEDDCSKCTRMKTGSALSLDYLKDENGLEVSEPVVDACGTVLTAVLFQGLMDKLRELDPELAKIFELLYDGKSQRSIAKIIGAKSQSSVESKIGRMRRILQQHVTREDILG